MLASMPCLKKCFLPCTIERRQEDLRRMDGGLDEEAWVVGVLFLNNM